VVLNCYYPNLKHAIHHLCLFERAKASISSKQAGSVRNRTSQAILHLDDVFQLQDHWFLRWGYQSELIATCSQTVSASYRRYISDRESSRKFRPVPLNQSLILTTELDEATTRLLNDVRDRCCPIHSYGIRVAPRKRTQLAALNRLPREHLELYIKTPENLSSKTCPFQ
jgi:hypothetical protein